MSTIYNDAGKNTLANGTTVTTANTGGGGNSQLASIVGSAPVKRTMDYPATGDTACYEFAAQTATAAYVTLPAPAWTTPNQGAAGAWFKFSGWPTVSGTFLRFGNSGAFYVGVLATGKFSLIQSGNVLYTSPTTIDFNTWYWVCHSLVVSATTGVERIGIWDDGKNLIGSFSTGAINTSAVTTAANFIGKSTASGNLALFKMAGFKVTTDSGDLLPPPMGSRGWDMAA